MHRRTFLLTAASVPLLLHTEARADPLTIIVKGPDENGRFAGALQRIVDGASFRPPFTCVVTFEFHEEDHMLWLPLDPPDPTTSQAGFIFESRRFDLIDRAVDYHHSMWRCRYGKPAPDTLTWERENRARRSRLSFVTLKFTNTEAPSS